MRDFLHRTLTDLRRCKSGNAMMMTALGLPALLGATGYGVDTAQWYMWQRELQHSVDQAAIGGAWALAYNNASTDYVRRARQEFFANQDKTAPYDSDPDVKLANFDTGTNNSVRVTATVTRRLPFTGMLLNRTTVVSASAQAAFKAGPPVNACLITLKEDGTTFTIGGNATVIANCGLAALSCGNNAVVIDGSASVTTTQIAACGTVNVPSSLQSKVVQHDELTDAYSDYPIPEPTASTETKTNQQRNYCLGTGNRAFANLFPAKYVGGITAHCDTKFNPGVYFIDGGVLDLSTNANVVGERVLFVLRKGAEIRLGGSGSTGSIRLSPMRVEDFEGSPYQADANKLAGMLFIEDKREATEPADHQINGNTRLNIEGVVYLPNGNVQINGDSGTTTDLCFQISAYTLDIRGSAYLRTLCDPNKSTLAGSATARVRLVA